MRLTIPPNGDQTASGPPRVPTSVLAVDHRFGDIQPPCSSGVVGMPQTVRRRLNPVDSAAYPAKMRPGPVVTRTTAAPTAAAMARTSNAIANYSFMLMHDQANPWHSALPGTSPNGSVNTVGAFPPYRYPFAEPPRMPIGSSETNRPKPGA
jgi:hypothetical protein